jgi:hypothetical protein
MSIDNGNHHVAVVTFVSTDNIRIVFTKNGTDVIGM